MKRLFTLLALSFILASALFAKQIKVLAIGNSFSDDAIEHYLHGLAAATGDEIIIGNLYIGGSSLEQHHNNSLNNSPVYSYRKIVNGVKTITESYTLQRGLQDEAWDYVSLQQVSQNSGQFDTYFPYIVNLMTYIRNLTTNPNMRIILHATWAYAQNSTHSGFSNYGNDQITMYNAIVDATTRVAQTTGIGIIIPAGTAIQNGRTSKLGDTFCRDGYHLELTYGRYTASCSWYEKLFEKTVVGNTYVPNPITPFQAEVAQQAAHNAVINPTTVTSLAHLADNTPYIPFTKNINLSFAGSAYEGWNVLSGFNVNDGINNLRDEEGNLTAVSAKITERFGGINYVGAETTTTPLNMPREISKDNFFGNTGNFGGVFPKATVVISSLAPDVEYDFIVFASRMNVTDNRETYYKFSGIESGDTTLYLNPANNTSQTVEALRIKPNNNGEIILEVGPGPNNNNGTGFYHITALRIIPRVQVQTVPFTEQVNITFANGPLDNAWNVLGDFRENARATYLRDINGNATDVSLVVTERFNHINGAGAQTTQTDMNMPPQVSAASFYGNTAPFMNIIVPKSTIKFTALNPDELYDFSMFSSRMSVSDNRETYFKFTGTIENDTTLYLDASNNSSNTVKAIGISPNAAGEIFIEVGPGPNNNNSTGFYYLNAMNIKPQNVSSAINETNISKLHVYPNPFTDNLHIFISDEVDWIHIMSMDGKLLKTLKDFTPNTVNQLMLSGLQKGVYILKSGNSSCLIIKK